MLNVLNEKYWNYVYVFLFICYYEQKGSDSLRIFAKKEMKLCSFTISNFGSEFFPSLV